MACPAGDGGLDDALLADCKAIHVRAEFGDDAAEFVAEGYGDGVVSAGVWCCGRKGWAAEVFVQVGAADTYVRGGDL